MANEFTLFVSENEVRDAAGFFAVPDRMDEASAAAFARKMARFHADEQLSGPTSERASKVVDLCEMLGHPDAANIDIERAWAPTRSGPPFADDDGMYHWGEQWLRFVVGRDPQTGRNVAIDFKETHEFDGMGHHMVLVGTTGSGKSQFLTTMITSACLTHSPELLNIAFFDFKGSSTAHAIQGFPHVVAAMNNLRNDSLWIDRMGDVLYGEMKRRQQLLDKANVGDVAEYEYLRIHKGEKLRPIPHLLLIVDEFTQMFKQHEAAKLIMDEVGRQGRSLALRLVMGSQRLGHEMSQGIMSNIPIRVALRTVGETDSRSVLGNDEANHLPVKPAGAGLLKVSSSKRMIRFQTAFASKTYIPPRQAVAAAVRAEAGYVAPQEFLATGMEPVEVAAPQVKDAGPAPKPVLGADGRTIKQVQAVIESLKRHDYQPARLLWLPPMESLPVDELVRRLRGRPWHENYGVHDDPSVLRFPVGLEDRPFYHRQTVYAPNLAESNCAVIGQAGSGKTTAIGTMIAGAALMYSPARVQFFVLSFSGPELNTLERLPHVGGFARETDAERVKRMIAETEALIDLREQEFGSLGLRLGTFRARKFGGQPGPVPSDTFGDVFIVIDGWPIFAKSFEPLTDAVMRILERGPQYGVHAIISTRGWIAGNLLSGMPALLTSNVELKLASNDDLTKNNGKVAKAVPYGEKEVYLDEDDEGSAEPQQKIAVRGRGTSMEGFHFQAGIPRMQVAGELVDIDAGVEWIADKAGTDAVATRVRVLPSVVTLDEVFHQWEARGGQRAGDVPFGISEVQLAPAVARFATSPHLLFAGRPECGLSTALRTVARSLMRVYTPDQARIYVIDPLHNLLRVVEGPHLGDYVFHENRVRALANALSVELEARKPAENLTQAELVELTSGKRLWSGPEIFVLIDREEEVQRWDRGGFTADSGYPLAPLVPLIAHGREIGLHFVVARRVTQWQRAVNSPLVGQLWRGAAPGVVMDGDRAEGPIIGETKAENFEPGRGIYVTDTLAAPVQIAITESV